MAEVQNPSKLNIWQQNLSWYLVKKKAQFLKTLTRGQSDFMDVHEAASRKFCSSLVLPLPGCAELNHGRYQCHDQLRNHQELEEEEAVEEALWLRRQDQAVQEVQPGPGQGQAEGCRAPGKTPAPRPPVLGHAQSQQGPAVPGQRGERHRVQTDPLATVAPLEGQRDGPVETEQQQMGRTQTTGLHTYSTRVDRGTSLKCRRNTFSAFTLRRW